MSLYIANEFKRFRSERKEKHELYRQLNMTQEQIDALDEFDTKEFLSAIRYNRHTQPLITEDYSEDSENRHVLYQKFGEVLTVELDLPSCEKYEWLDDIDSLALLKRLHSLPSEDLDILNAYVFEGKTQTEIAEKMNVSQQAIQKRIARIIKNLGISRIKKI